MKDLMKCLKLIRYQKEFKLSLVCAVGMYILGGIWTLADLVVGNNDSAYLSVMGSIFMIIGPMALMLAIFQSCMTGSVGSCRARKFIHISYPAYICLLSILSAELGILIFGGIGLLIDPSQTSVIAAGLVMAPVLGAFYIGLTGICYKLHPSALVLEIFIIVSINNLIIDDVSVLIYESGFDNIGAALIIGIGITLVSSLFIKGLCRTFYKKPFNKNWIKYVEQGGKL